MTKIVKNKILQMPFLKGQNLYDEDSFSKIILEHLMKKPIDINLKSSPSRRISNSINDSLEPVAL